MPRDLVLDTDTLSELKPDGDIDLTQAKEADVNYYVPVAQEVEFLRDINDQSEEIRESILEVLEELEPEQIELDSAPFGNGPFGHGPFGKMTDRYKELIEQLNNIEEDENNSWDVLGAETAISRDMEFVTRDDNLKELLEDYSEEHLLHYEDYKRLVENDS